MSYLEPFVPHIQIKEPNPYNKICDCCGSSRRWRDNKTVKDIKMGTSLMDKTKYTTISLCARCRKLLADALNESTTDDVANTYCEQYDGNCHRCTFHRDCSYYCTMSHNVLISENSNEDAM